MSQDLTALSRFSLRFMMFSVLSTIVFMTWSRISSFNIYRKFNGLRHEVLRMEQLRGSIIHLEEVLTMSARMAAVTGDLKWEKRYRDFEKELDSNIKEIKVILPSLTEIEGSQTDLANQRLVTMENQAFELVHQNLLQEAQKVLFSQDYEDQKKIYAQGMIQIAENLQKFIEDQIQQDEQKALTELILAILVMFVLMSGWFLMIKSTKNWQEVFLKQNQQLAQRARELADWNVTLDQKIAMGTQEVKANEERIRLILETAFDAFIAMDRQGLITDWNRQAQIIFGWSKEDVLGKKLAEFIIPPKYREAHQKGMGLFFKNGEGPVLNKRIEITALNREGNEFPVEITIWPLRMDGSVSFNAFVHDITARKRVEEELKKANQELMKSEDKIRYSLIELESSNEELKMMQSKIIQSERSAMMNQLAAGIAHEVKNPLAILMQGVDYLVSHNSTNGDPNVPMVLKDMSHAIERADYTIKGLFDLSRPVQMILDPEDLNSIIESAITLIKNFIDRHGVQIAKNLASHLPLISADRGRLAQIFINLLSNSTDAMPKGGEIKITTYSRKLTDPPSGVVGRRKSDIFKVGQEVVVAEIEDQGSGIPMDVLPKVFEPFFTTKRGRGGTGLGLSVVKNIVEMHHGNVEIGNRGEGGARVVLSFPAIQE